MFCSRCGSEVTEKSKFCPSCGLDLMSTTPVSAIASGQLTEVDIVREALKAEYQIVGELGRGGMALVYRARDLELDREVAIKVLPFSLAFDGEFVERFQREARLSAQLEHPNIVPIYRVGRAGRVIYFTMKYLRGGALSNVLTERQKLTPPEIRRLLVEAGSALGYAAQRGIVHRDIKPDNIMFDEFGQVMLTDFGIAKAASGQKLTGTGMSIGTPHYMSPEQARAQAIDGRSDIYSLGIVAFQCLAGVVPYDGDDSFSIGYKHITEAIPTPALATADERRIFEVIKRMLMKDPQDRFQSCEELVAALRGQPTAAAGSIHGRQSVPSPTGVPSAAAPAPAAAFAGAAAAAASVRAAVPPAPIGEQPTTPIPAAGSDRRSLERRDLGRRIADRSPAARRRASGPSMAWLWGVLAALAVGGGGYYYLAAHGFAPGREPSADAGDSTPQQPVAVAESAQSESAPRYAGAPRDTATPVDTARVAATPRVGSSDTAAQVVTDSGSLRVVGLPSGSVVTIDERPVSDPVNRLSAGRHALGISAPRHQFYLDTVAVTVGQVTEVRPVLARIGAPVPVPAPRAEAPPPAPNCTTPGPGYNAGGACFDVRPVPKTPTFVPVPADVQGQPGPSVLWVKVSESGETLDLRTAGPSSDPAFERDVRAFARQLSWRPASKGSQSVEAWTQWKFDPARP